jgi:hypothetical protein
VAPGSTVGQVRQAYGETAEVVPGDEVVAPYVRADLGAPHPLVMGTTGDRVSSISAGEPCT